MNKNLNSVITMEELDFVSHSNTHGKQKDIAKQPYINHLLRVRMFAAKMLKTLLANEKISKDNNGDFVFNVLQTAMLHDVLEDCDVSKISNNQELQTYWKKIPDNVMQAMQRLNKNNYPSKNEYIKNILSIDTPLHSIINSGSNQQTMDIVPYIALVVKMADTLDNMNIFRLTNSIHTFAKLFQHHIENDSESILGNMNDSNGNNVNNGVNDSIADINHKAIQLAFDEFNALSNDKKSDFIIHQLTNEYNQGNAFAIKTINRLNDYWHNWQNYVNTYYFAFNKNKIERNNSVAAKLDDTPKYEVSLTAKIDSNNANDMAKNDEKNLNIKDLINHIKGQYVLLDINLYDIENLNKTAKQLYWIDDIYSETYHTIQKQICCVKDNKRKLKYSV